MQLSQKGEIAIGKDADLFFLDENQTYTVSEDQLFYKNKHTPYTGRKIDCKITQVIVRGSLVYDALDGFQENQLDSLSSRIKEGTRVRDKLGAFIPKEVQRDGNKTGSLAGLTFAVKDVMAVKGITMALVILIMSVKAM